MGKPAREAPKGPGRALFFKEEEVDKTDQAVAYFNEGFNCSQAITAAFGPDLGLDRELSLKVSAAFGGGISRMGETCGAVTGALMVIGLLAGRTRADDKDAHERTARLAEDFLERFRHCHFTVVCRELLGCEPGKPEGMQFMKEHGLKERLCTQFVKDAAEILGELLAPGISGTFE